MTPFDEALRSAIRTAVHQQLSGMPVSLGRLVEIRASLTETLQRAVPASGDTVQDIAMRAAIAAHLDAVFAELGHHD
jgi:hypothetical protein